MFHMSPMVAIDQDYLLAFAIVTVVAGLMCWVLLNAAIDYIAEHRNVRWYDPLPPYPRLTQSRGSHNPNVPPYDQENEDAP